MTKYEKRGKYLPILHEKQRAITTVSLNALWNQMQQELSHLLPIASNVFNII